MELEFPYQIVTFLDKEPQVNEPVYLGKNGWYPQLALKRRFKLLDIDSSQLIQLLEPLAHSQNELQIITGSLIKPEQMPVRVIDIKNQAELKSFHKQLLTRLNGDIASRYPEREDENYYAHITSEYNSALVIDPNKYSNRCFNINNIWILKDIDDENSIAYVKIK